jgi:hypothetical protein
MAAEGRGSIMFAQVALLKALSIWKPKPLPASRKKATTRYKVIR